MTSHKVQVAYIGQGYTGEEAEYAAVVHNLDLQVMAQPEGQTGFVARLRRWVVERRCGWATRFRCMVRDFEWLALTRQQFHFLAFVTLLLAKDVFRATKL